MKKRFTPIEFACKFLVEIACRFRKSLIVPVPEKIQSNYWYHQTLYFSLNFFTPNLILSRDIYIFIVSMGLYVNILRIKITHVIRSNLVSKLSVKNTESDGTIYYCVSYPEPEL